VGPACNGCGEWYYSDGTDCIACPSGHGQACSGRGLGGCPGGRCICQQGYYGAACQSYTEEHWWAVILIVIMAGALLLVVSGVGIRYYLKTGKKGT
jgi:hypothetical protein